MASNNSTSNNNSLADSQMRTPGSSSVMDPRLDTFRVVLQKAAQGRLGICVVAVPIWDLKDVGLMVTEIQAGGAADLHNRMSPAVKQICPGNVIVGVNDVELNVSHMIKVLEEVTTSQSEQVVEVFLLRQLVRLDAGGSPTSSQTASTLAGCRSRSTSQASTDGSCGSHTSKDDSRGTPWSSQTTSTFADYRSAARLQDIFTRSQLEVSPRQVSQESQSLQKSSQASTDSSSSSFSSPDDSRSSVDHLPEVDDLVPLDAHDFAARRKQFGCLEKISSPTETTSQEEADTAQERPTTIMLSRLPDTFNRAQLEAILDREGFAGLYDFAYAPINLRTHGSFHYAFVNLVDGDVAVACKDILNGYALDSDDWATEVCTMTSAWATKQGLQANIERYRDSPLMHESVPYHSQPAIFHRGARVDFPAPTKALKAPKLRKALEVPPEVQDVPLPRLGRFSADAEA